MLISLKQLQSYFSKPLPSVDELSDVFAMGSFEIDGVEKVREGTPNVDTILEVKTLPDRNAYCLSHRYIAQELGALLMKKDAVYKATLPVYEDTASASTGTVHPLAVHITAPERCRRYMGRVIEGIKVEASPEWLKLALEGLGQRSINTIVDLTNYVMLETGQPLHAFDADLVKGDITVRYAKDGEQLTLLDARVLTLAADMLVIADDEGPLALAGIKGGKRAEISALTTRIILESANFTAPETRRTAQVVNIKNESSKRFENAVTPERAELALKAFCTLLKKEIPVAVFGEVIDMYPEPATPFTFTVKAADISRLLGVDVPVKEVVSILKSLDIEVEENSPEELKITAPVYRPDLRLTVDIADEVGRVHGLEHVPSKVPAPFANREVHKNFYYYNLIRKTLAVFDFSEVYTYTLRESGDMALQNPLNIERSHMRNDLSSALDARLESNLRFVDLLGLKDVKIFEVGNIFGGKHERMSLALGISRAKQPKGIDQKGEMQTVLDAMIKVLGVSPDSIKFDIKISAVPGLVKTTVEFDLTELIEKLPQPSADIEWPALIAHPYKKISPYPFMVRDIAVFVPGEQSDASQKTVLDIISAHGTDLLVRTDLFDVFTKNKEGEPVQTSYAYRLVFQAADRTLVEEEINTIMQKITDDMNARDGWKVR